MERTDGAAVLRWSLETIRAYNACADRLDAVLDAVK